MTFLTADRDTTRRENMLRSFPVKAAARIYAGALVCVDSTGFAVRGAVATTLKAVGRAEESANNTAGADGAISVTTMTGVFRYANSTAGDLVVLADVESQCFIVTDSQVAKTNGGDTRSVAGIVRHVDAGGVWVEIGMAR